MSRFKNQFEFMSGLFVDGELYFNKYVLTIDFYTLADSLDDRMTAMDRLSYLIHDVVARSIFICEDDTDQINLINAAGMSVLTVPAPGPADAIVMEVLITKMNAIIEDTIVIDEAEIISELSAPIVCLWDEADDDTDQILVSTTDQTKWWVSADPRFGSYPEGVDVQLVEQTQPFPTTWASLKLDWIDDISDEVTAAAHEIVKNTEVAGIVIQADFTKRPKAD